MDQQLGVMNVAPTENDRRGDIHDALRTTTEDTYSHGFCPGEAALKNALSGFTKVLTTWHTQRETKGGCYGGGTAGATEPLACAHET